MEAARERRGALEAQIERCRTLLARSREWTGFAPVPFHDALSCALELLDAPPLGEGWTAGLGVDAVGGSVPRLVQAARCRGWSPYHRDLTGEALAEAHALGLKVVVWTVNEVDEMLALARLGVDGIITDYPDRAIKALAPWRSRD